MADLLIKNDSFPSSKQNFLDEILSNKREEVALKKQIFQGKNWENFPFFARNCFSLKQNLLYSPIGIIAEFKRKSPSKGWIHADARVEEITFGYNAEGAAGISILTDTDFFGGSTEDITTVRNQISCPVLRKDFVVDEFQIYEAKAIGADVVLLIAAALTIPEVKNFARLAHRLGLEVLLEVHNKEELSYLNEFVDVVGVNNRNLKTFQVDTGISADLAGYIPTEFVKISESGISNIETVKELNQLGYRGFLMGENFMKETHPAFALKEFLKQLNA